MKSRCRQTKRGGGDTYNYPKRKKSVLYNHSKKNKKKRGGAYLPEKDITPRGGIFGYFFELIAKAEIKKQLRAKAEIKKRLRNKKK